MALTIALYEAARERRSLINRLEVAYREYTPLRNRDFPGYLDRLNKVVLVMAEVSDFNRACPQLAIPKLVDGMVPVPILAAPLPILGTPISDTSRPVQT